MRVLLRKVWSGSLGQSVAHIGDRSNGPAVCIAFHPNGQQLLAGFHSGHLCLYDISTGLLALSTVIISCIFDGLPWSNALSRLIDVYILNTLISF